VETTILPTVPAVPIRTVTLCDWLLPRLTEPKFCAPAAGTPKIPASQAAAITQSSTAVGLNPRRRMMGEL
jgi:hypothetical protein